MGFLHSLTLALVIVINFVGAGILSLEYFTAIRLLANENKDTEGKLAYRSFVDECIFIRRVISNWILRSMVIYIFSIAFGFAKSQRANGFGFKAIVILSVFFGGGVSLISLFLAVHAKMRKAMDVKLRDSSLFTVSKGVAMSPINNRVKMATARKNQKKNLELEYFAIQENLSSRISRSSKQQEKLENRAKMIIKTMGYTPTR